jgi:hypothetical protein
MAAFHFAHLAGFARPLTLSQRRVPAAGILPSHCHSQSLLHADEA